MMIRRLLLSPSLSVRFATARPLVILASTAAIGAAAISLGLPGQGPISGLRTAFAGPQDFRKDGPPREGGPGGPPGFGPGGPGGFGGPGGPGGPGGFGPGMFIAPRIMEAGDTDGDGKLSPAEAKAGARKFVEASTPKGKSGLDEETLARALNQHVGPEGDPEVGPGFFIAPALLELADTDKNKTVSADEAAEFAATTVAEADTEKVGGIETQALAQAINTRIGPPPGFGPGGPGGPGGPPGFGGDREIAADYDTDGDGKLSAEERQTARAELKKERAAGPGRGRPGFGPRGGMRPPGFGGEETEATPGKKVAPKDVKHYPDKGLYDDDIVRTVFLDFENDDWEAELEEFHGTDVEVPAEMTVDGQKYPGVGVHFRGMSSYMGVSAGHKRSLNVSIDFSDENQRLYGYKTLNLLNSHEDPSFLHTVLYSKIARAYIPAPKANFVHVVINGESWGLYANAQQFDKIFLTENHGSPKGARWKVRGNPGADGGLRYVGDDQEEYENRFQMKSGGKKDWKALIELCRVIDETPADELKDAIEPILDVDGVLKFLALDNVLINGDGYWTRASDYSLFRDGAGKFHLIPHDMNEAFGPAMMFGPGMGPGGPGGGRFGGPGMGPGGPGGGRFGGPPGGAQQKRQQRGGPQGKQGRGFGGPGMGPGGPGGPGGGNVDLDPLIGLENQRTPLRSKLLAVPEYKARYLELVKLIADEWLDWNRMGPIVAAQAKLIEPYVKEDTRKLSTFEAFQAAVADSPAPAQAAPARGRPVMSLRTFADKRRAYLLAYPGKAEPKK